jgi:hypothetical protein
VKLFPHTWRWPLGTKPFSDRVCCYDCLLPHPEGNDCVLPDDVWEQINPTESEGGGILCANCIMRRLDFLGISDVSATLW